MIDKIKISDVKAHNLDNALIVAIMHGHPLVVSKLISKGADIFYMYEQKLKVAANRNDVNLVSCLLKSVPKEYIIPHTKLALQVAVDKGYLSIMKLLINFSTLEEKFDDHFGTKWEEENDINNQISAEYLLTISIFRGHLDSVKYLLDSFPRVVDELDGKKGIDFSKFAKLSFKCTDIIKYKSIFECLREHGIIVNYDNDVYITIQFQ